jgi:hypothetical protein
MSVERLEPQLMMIKSKADNKKALLLISKVENFRTDPSFLDDEFDDLSSKTFRIFADHAQHGRSMRREHGCFAF